VVPRRIAEIYASAGRQLLFLCFSKVLSPIWSTSRERVCAEAITLQITAAVSVRCELQSLSRSRLLLREIQTRMRRDNAMFLFQARWAEAASPKKYRRETRRHVTR
jgi:hypothetical protein